MSQSFVDAMPFAKAMGVEILEAGPDLVRGRLTVREDHCTAGGVLHGGAVMAFADSLGAIAGFLRLAPGQRTTTLESKTNFLGSAPVGAVIIAETRPVHAGKRTSVWETRLSTEDGKPIALVIQTQMVLS